MQLLHVAEAGADDHLAPHGMPIREARRAEFAVAPRRLGDRTGDGRDAVGDEVLVRCDDVRLGERDRDGEEDGDEQQTRELDHG
jgi:hypothetical protein